MPLPLFPQQRAVRESREYPVLKGRMLDRPVIVALKGDSFTTPADAVTAGSHKPASAMLGTSKKEWNRVER